MHVKPVDLIPSSPSHQFTPLPAGTPLFTVPIFQSYFSFLIPKSTFKEVYIKDYRHAFFYWLYWGLNSEPYTCLAGNVPL
jgi:hypothetical protein